MNKIKLGILLRLFCQLRKAVHIEFTTFDAMVIRLVVSNQLARKLKVDFVGLWFLPNKFLSNQASERRRLSSAEQFPLWSYI
jgi:hypothetical protein